MTNIYKMTVDLNVLDHLGINLYSNIAAVLTEAVANAWDADASSVQIRVDPNSDWIEIADDGIGGAAPAVGSGLSGLADRVAAVGGRLTIDSKAGRGTRVVADLPLNGWQSRV